MQFFDKRDLRVLSTPFRQPDGKRRQALQTVYSVIYHPLPPRITTLAVSQIDVHFPIPQQHR